LTSNQKKSGDTKRARRFAVFLTLALVAGLTVFGVAAGVNLFQAGWFAGLALAGGVVATIALGVSLMALAFYSNRSGADDAVSGMGEDERTL